MKFSKGFSSFNRILGEKEEIKVKALTCLISACIGCCMNADFTHTNLQSFFENDMVKTEIRSNNVDQNQDEIWDYRNCFKNYKNCAYYVDEDQNGICDYCLNHEDLANKSCTHKHTEHRAHSNYR